MNSFDVIRRQSGKAGIDFLVRGVASATFVGLVAVAACSNSNSGAKDGGGSGLLMCQVPPAEIADAAALVKDSGATCAAAGTGVTTGAADMHCGSGASAMRQPTSQASCCASVDASGGGGGGEACNDAGMAIGKDDGTCCMTDYQPSMFGQQGSDDDCKYDVSWTATPICVGMPVYFTVKANKRDGTTGGFASGPPLTGAGPSPDITQDCMTAIQTNDSNTVESAPGVYQIGPIVFPQAGIWDFRFHFNENCLDEVPDSPHGHAGFWITVPGATGSDAGGSDASSNDAESEASNETDAAPQTDATAEASSSQTSDAAAEASSDAAPDGPSDATGQ